MCRLSGPGLLPRRVVLGGAVSRAFSCAGRKSAWGGVQAALKDKSGDSFTLTVAVSLVDISVVDHVPEELLNATATGV